MTFAEQIEVALKNSAASDAVMRQANAFFESHRVAIDQTLNAYRIPHTAGVLEAAQRLLDSQIEPVLEAMKAAQGLKSFDMMLRRASESLSGAEALFNTGAYIPMRALGVDEPEVQAAAASVAAAALVGVADESLTLEVLDQRITEAAASVRLSPDELLPVVSVPDAVRFAIWMVVAPALLILWNDPLVGPWLQSHFELLVVLLAFTAWGVKGVAKA